MAKGSCCGCGCSGCSGCLFWAIIFSALVLASCKAVCSQIIAGKHKTVNVSNVVPCADSSHTR